MTKIFSLNELSKLLTNHQSPITLVLATGCFDILHQGHKDFLKTAKKQGGVLIVGLESDKRVRKLKGESRPINSWKKRAKNLARINKVDYIFSLPGSFDNVHAHLELLQLIKPNILAVSENTPYLEKKRKLIEKIRGRLFVFPFNSKYSTSKLILDK